MSHLTTDARPPPMLLASAGKRAGVISEAQGARNPRGEFTTELRSVVILLGGAGDHSLRSGALLEAPVRKSPTGKIAV